MPFDLERALMSGDLLVKRSLSRIECPLRVQDFGVSGRQAHPRRLARTYTGRLGLFGYFPTTVLGK